MLDAGAILYAFGEIVFKNDPYIEEMGTLWFLHYMLASNKDEATAWYFFYNEFKQSEFNKEDFVKQLSNYIMINGEEVSERSLEDDYNCIINTYVPVSNLLLKKFSRRAISIVLLVNSG
mgnify:FL=1